MRQKRLLPFLLSAPLLFASCGGGQSNTATTNTATNSVASTSPTPAATPAPTPAQQEVRATVAETKVKAGGSGEATITLDIKEGYHVHANPASDKYYIPTEVTAAPKEGLTPGKPVYPKSVMRKLGFADKPLAFYEGRVVIRLPIRADASVPTGIRTLRAKIRVQPCNDEACFPPREIEAVIPVTVN